MSETDGQSLAVLCDERGIVLDLLRNDFAAPLQQGDAFTAIVGDEDQSKFERLLATAVLRQAAFDWLINVHWEGRAEMLHFAAAQVEGSIVIVGGHSRSMLVHLSQGLVARGPASVEPLRQVLEATAKVFERRADLDSELYDELSRLNNDLSSTQRQLIKTNHALALANHQLRAFYDALPVGIVRTDVAGRVVEANARYLALTGCALGSVWHDAVNDQDREKILAQWQRHRDINALFRCGYRSMGGSGEPMELELTLTPFVDDQGARAGFVGVVEDVSESRKLARQQRQLEREADLRAVIGQLAHHLNNIMTIVIGAAEDVVEQLPVDAPEAESARMGSLAGQRAARLVRALMIYCGVASLPKESFALDAVLEDIAARQRNSNSLPAGVALVADFQADHATVRLPRELFVEALEGLLANARAALGEQGSITLGSRWLEPGSAGQQVSISISDDGTGMDAETLRRVAEPFFTTRPSTESTGLGVPLADGFARQFGGTLHIDSAPGAGTRVALMLPAESSRPVNGGK